MTRQKKAKPAVTPKKTRKSNTLGLYPGMITPVGDLMRLQREAMVDAITASAIGLLLPLIASGEITIPALTSLLERASSAYGSPEVKIGVKKLESALETEFSQ